MTWKPVNTFAMITLGCKVNRYESEAVAEQLSAIGMGPANKDSEPDLCVVNTCAVTARAAMQSRQAIRRAVREYQGAYLVVTGCYAQIASDVCASIDGVNRIVGNTFKDRIPAIVAGIAGGIEKGGNGSPLVEDLSAPRLYQDLRVTQFGSRTRPFLKIQDGCDSFCSYCIVPYARGRSRSLAPEIVAERFTALMKQGYSEVVLCGINIGRYGVDLNPPTSLSGLICSLDASRATGRVRLSSIEPWDLSEDLIFRMARSDRFCRHLHIPLQSGDDEILERMSRPYSADFYRQLVLHVAEALPGVAIGADIVAGFPGETPKAFQNTFRLISELPIAYLHVFPFSPRDGTPASLLSNRVHPQEIKKRCQYLRKLGEEKRRRFHERHLGTYVEVLIEGKRDPQTGCLQGFTGNYIPVILDGPDEWSNKVLKVKLAGEKAGKIFGVRID